MTVSVSGPVRYGELVDELRRGGVALGNLASLPHISVAGAVSTATHGSGDGNGNLATAVAGLELVTSGGDVVSVARGDPEFDGMVVGLGALGVLTRVTLDVELDYSVRQRVYERLGWDELLSNLDDIMASGYSVSVFSRWGETVEKVWIKSRVGTVDDAAREDLFGAPAAVRAHHPIAGLDPVHATPQLGEAGPWSERLPHFRMGFTPSSGAEIQSEYLVPRHHGIAAIEAVLGLGPRLGPLLQVSEIRTMAADRLWMSPQYGQDTVGLHFTWNPDQAAVEHALIELERALAPFSPRPHWGKLFLASADTIGSRYPRLGEFAGLVKRLDPRGAFTNPWLERHVLGGGGRS
jgi:xylitol oxidase